MRREAMAERDVLDESTTGYPPSDLGATVGTAGAATDGTGARSGAHSCISVHGF